MSSGDLHPDPADHPSPARVPRPDTARVEWKRILAEAAAIVASILLAFAVDAWWDARVEQRRADELIGFLRADIEDTRAYLAEERATSEELTVKARAILDAMAGRRPATDSLIRSLGSVFIVPDWTPMNATYEQALGSGDLGFIRDVGLRTRLARYAGQLDEVGVIRDLSRTQYYAALEPFLVTNTSYAEIAAEWWRDQLVQGPFATDYAALAQNRELWNLLTLKLELELAAVARLERAQMSADSLLTILGR